MNTQPVGKHADDELNKGGLKQVHPRRSHRHAPRRGSLHGHRLRCDAPSRRADAAR